MVLAGCRETETRSCAQARVLHDPPGARLERERIELQWARVEGRFDSVVATRSGKAAQDRAAGSVSEASHRYEDSLLPDRGGLRSLDGCVDWSATWAAGDFDRLGLANAFLARLAPSRGYSAIEVGADTTSLPAVLRIDALPAGSGFQGSPKVFRVRLDSFQVVLLPETN